MSLLLAQAAVNDANIHFDKLYSYRIPAELAGRVFPGSMVLVPFGRGSKARMAVVLAVGEVDESDAPKGLKTLYDAAPEDARLTPDLLELVRFLKERTFCTWFEAVKAVIPYGAQYRPAVVDGRHVMQGRLTRSTERLYTLAGALPEKPKPGPRQLAAVAALQNGPLTARQLDEVGISRSTLDGLVKKGVLTAAEQDKAIDLFAAIPFDPQPLELSPEQQQAFNDLLPNLEDARPHAALLHGVTGSGKTIVFLRLIQRTLELGRRALVLVPEISLTPQMIRRLKSTFGSRLAVQHSALNNTERLLQWRMIQQGNADIVVGTRSAVFAPLQNLGLIIMDEEQEHTYQSESAPRFDAHDVAKKRAVMENALLLFASATPLTETYHAAESGKLQLVQLTHRYGGRPLPSVDFIDMRAEQRRAEHSAAQPPWLPHHRHVHHLRPCAEMSELQRAARLPQAAAGTVMPPLRPHGTPAAADLPRVRRQNQLQRLRHPAGGGGAGRAAARCAHPADGSGFHLPQGRARDDACTVCAARI